jgi:hypothetical protein
MFHYATWYILLSEWADDEYEGENIDSQEIKKYRPTTLVHASKHTTEIPYTHHRNTTHRYSKNATHKPLKYHTDTAEILCIK